MCEREYVGCPECSAAADSGSITYRVDQHETIGFYLNAQGDRDYDQEPEYGEPWSDDQGEYVCQCGWGGHSLGDECRREDCECVECNEPEYDEVDPDLADEDAFVRMVNYPSAETIAELPHELRILAEDRCVWVALIPRWRSAELFAEWSHLITVGYEPTFPVRMSVARELMPTYPAYDDREVCTA